MKKKTINIYGGGSTALLLACFLDSSRFEISIFEKNKALGRKFLVAGKGGFNLTHGEDVKEMIKRYLPLGEMDACLSSFTNIQLREWLDSIGVPTFVGSSNRVFPVKGIKPIEVLKAIEIVLENRGVKIFYEHSFSSFNKGVITVETKGEMIEVKSDYTVFALGGKSWGKTGSTGNWIEEFRKNDIEINPFQASNCAVKIDWSKNISDKLEGKPLKNIGVLCEDVYKRGEGMITRFGLEGGVVYAHSNAIRNQLNKSGNAVLFLDLKPDLSLEQVSNRLENRGAKISWTSHIQKCLNMDKSGMTLLKELLTKEDFLNPRLLAEKIKDLPIPVLGLAPIDEAISTVGGVSWKALSPNFELKNSPHHFAIGEMVDWDAPTGGYLLQGCFSMGYYLAQYLNKEASA